jgi:hypothetical protein
MLVDGREVDRVVGVTAYSRLEQMFKLGTATASANPPAATPSQMSAPSGPPVVSLPSMPQSNALASPPINVPASPPPLANQPPSPLANTAAGVSEATLIAASVRLRVEDANGHSCGSGTIVDARDGEALILTCGHIFRESKRDGKIEVDLFGPGGPQRVPGRLISYSVPPLSPQSNDPQSRDVGLVAIHVPGPLVTARIAPPGYRIQRGMPVVSVGCNNGNPPTAQRSQVTSLDKFVGPPSIQVAGQPVEGRSGGGLFSSEGYVIGVCNAADPSDKEGLFAALGSIHAELDRKDVDGKDLSFAYKAPGDNSASATAMANSTAPGTDPVAAMPQQMPSPTASASLGAAPLAAAEAPAGLPPHEQAALDEVRRHKKEGTEVIFIVRSHDNPNGKSEVFVLDNASPEFIRQLSAEGRPQEKPFPTSLEVPKPPKKLLEWSAQGN